MHNFYFWKSWPSSYKFSFWFLILLLGFLTTNYFLMSYLGVSTSLSWEVSKDLGTVDSVVKSFNLGLFNFQIPAKSYYLFESYVANDISISTEIVYAFLSFSIVGMLILVSVLTCLNRFWFALGIALFSFLVLNFQFEQLTFLGQYSKYSSWLILVLYLLPSFYFHYLKTNVPFTLRVFVFFVLTGFIGLYIGLNSTVSEPLVYLANYGIYASLILTVLFILMLASEVYVLFVRMLPSNSENMGTKNIIHFLVLSLIYFVNLFLVYKNVTQNSSWNFVYINAFVLLGLAIVSGLFNWKHRIEKMGGAFPFFPLGAFFYVGMSIVSLSTILYFFYTANDPFLEVVEDTILYSQMGFGVMFLVYVLSNFGTLLLHNKAVYKVLYKPYRMSYALYFALGLGLTSLLFLKSDWAALSQVKAGYYNGIASVYSRNGDTFTSQEYYKLASRYSYKNHCSHYSLSSLALKEGDVNTAIYALKNALGKHTSPFAYARLSNLYKEEGKLFDALFLLQEAVHTYPENEHLLNNLGVLYSKTNMTDSALYYFNKARLVNPSNTLVKSNDLALKTKHKLAVELTLLDELMKEERLTKALQINALALSNLHSKKLPTKSLSLFMAEDTDLDTYESLVLNNLNVNQQGSPVLRDFLHQAIKDSSNYDKEELLSFNYAIGLYLSDSVYKSFDFLEKLSLNHPKRSANYLHTLGLLSLDQNSPAKASAYFQRASALNFPKAKLNNLIADSELGLTKGMQSRWEGFKISHTKLSADMQWLYLDQNKYSLEKASDEQLYQLVRYAFRMYSVENQLGICQLISDSFKKNLALLLVAEHSLENRENSNFQKSIDLIDSNNPRILARKNDLLLKHYFLLNNEKALAALLEKAQDNPTDLTKLYTLYLGAVKSKEQKTIFSELTKNNPFKVEQLLVSSRYFSNLGELEKAYVLLQKALAYNPYDLDLQEEFIYVALKNGLEDYAKIALEDLQNICPEGRFGQVRANYEIVKQNKGNKK